ncbi:MAG TPA: ASCH domain-containing protein [Polyangiaceae bacterium]|nr:ASCH domain-containing protein [Polyangiaceae bacterium]
MRALSVKQPWAELIALGKKKIEFRTWQRDFRGDLLIVASKSRQDDECEEEGLDPTRLVYGAAICVVDFWKVTGSDGDYEWHLRAPRRVEPFAVKGYASIYNVDDALIREVDGGATRHRAAASRGAKVAGARKSADETGPRPPVDRSSPEARAKREAGAFAPSRLASQTADLVVPTPRRKKKPTFIR